MSHLIEQIADIIKDYRNEDLKDNDLIINRDHVKKWIYQFEIDEQEIVLNELYNNLKFSYFSKERVIGQITGMIDVISEVMLYDNPHNFLDHTEFLDMQKEYKSQKVYLDILNNVLKTKYGREINDSSLNIHNLMYVDDSLCTGGTIYRHLEDLINKVGKEQFKNGNIKIICSFTIAHKWAINNLRNRLAYLLNVNNVKIRDIVKIFRVIEIENDPRINFQGNVNPIFNNVYPIKSELSDEILNFIEEKFKNKYDFNNEIYSNRDEQHPLTEVFFTNAENRKKYENILLKYGYKIMTKIESEMARGLRPLGMTNPSNKTLGTGTHYFIWRNISNTCPLIFWWGPNDVWYPLFPVKNRGL